MENRCSPTLALFLAFVLANPLGAKPARSIKDQVNDIPIGGKLTVQKKNGTEYHGRLESVGPETFSIDEVDLSALAL